MLNKNENSIQNNLSSFVIRLFNKREGEIMEQKEQEEKVIEERISQFKVEVETEFPLAFDSPDHLYPWGTKRDNSTDGNFINETILHFGQGIKTIQVLDIGCSGGQMVRDFNVLGQLAVGIEGSDYSVKNKRRYWDTLHNKLLFTCDASRPYKVKVNGEDARFDLITAWEVLEHIHPDRLDTFFENIYLHMYDHSEFVASISMVSDKPEGHELHLSLFIDAVWKEKLEKHFIVSDYHFGSKVRKEKTSIYVSCKKKLRAL